MDCAARKKLIKEAKSFPEVMTVLQEAKIGTSGMELARTAFQIREAQPALSTHFLDTVIKEMEDNDKKEQESTGGESHQASNRADPLEQKQKNTPDGANPDTSATGTENQMKEDIMGMLHPEIAGQMMPQQMPAMTMPQQIKQMQYTVQKMTAPLLNKIKEIEAENSRLKEAISTLDTKLRETVANSARTISLEIPKNRQGVKEAVSIPLQIPTPNKSIEDRRNEISDLNRMMNSGEIKVADIYH